jgi:hypothetical protein
MNATDVAFLKRGACMRERDASPTSAVDGQWECLCALPHSFSEFRYLLPEA